MSLHDSVQEESVTTELEAPFPRGVPTSCPQSVVTEHCLAPEMSPKRHMESPALCVVSIGFALTLLATGISLQAFGGFGKLGALPFPGWAQHIPDWRLVRFPGSRPITLSEHPVTPFTVPNIATVLHSGGSSSTRRKGLLSWGDATVQATPGQWLRSQVAPPMVTTSAPHASAPVRPAPELPALAAPPPGHGAVHTESWLAEVRNMLQEHRLPARYATLALILVAAVALVVARGAGAGQKTSSALAPALCNDVDDEFDSPQEEFLLEVFDSLDHRRLGFIDRPTIASFLGPSKAAREMESVVMGPLNRLFYADFRRLAREPGPLADAVRERMAKRRRLVDLARATMPSKGIGALL